MNLSSLIDIDITTDLDDFDIDVIPFNSISKKEVNYIYHLAALKNNGRRTYDRKFYYQAASEYLTSKTLNSALVNNGFFSYVSHNRYIVYSHYTRGNTIPYNVEFMGDIMVFYQAFSKRDIKCIGWFEKGRYKKGKPLRNIEYLLGLRKSK